MSTVKSKVPQRDTVTTINADGSRFFVHPADFRGRWLRWRQLVAGLLLGLFVLLPWIPVGGHPAVFLDVTHLRFHLFGFTLAAQDAWLLFFLISGLAFSLFYITAFLGRIWCGWACPQTLFLEHVYRKVERWIDGDAVARRALEKAPWTPEKTARRILKHGIFVLLSLAIAHIFLAYFISIPQLWSWMLVAPSEHWKAFLFVMVISLILYVNFAWFREQLCLIICPYGRLQSALVDEHSVNVAYDYRRGDPPGPVRDANAGDCIDCRRCVQVCPTGIDIRQGLQLECIACTACMDACDEIMDKVKRPRGLIRYASEENLEGRGNRLVRPRTILYTALLLLGMSVAGYSLMQVQPVVFTATRMAGAPYFITDSGVRNQYQVRIVNKTDEARRFFFQVNAVGEPLSLRFHSTQDGVLVQPLGEVITTVVVTVDATDFQGRFPLQIWISDDRNSVELARTVDFLGPDPGLLRARLNAQPATTDE